MTDRLRVLHVLVRAQPTNGQYNEHCLPLVDERDITVCSFRPSTITPSAKLRMFEGRGGVRSGWSALGKALDADDYDVVHVHAPQTGALVLLRAGRRRRLANAVYTVQNSYQNYRLRNRLLMAFIFAAYPEVVFCSRAVLDSMPRAMRRLVRHKQTVIPNAVDLRGIDDAIVRPPVDRSPDRRLRVVFVGRLIPIKNARMVIHAIATARVPGIELVIVGDGELRAELEEAVDSTGVRDRTTFTGLVERHEVYRQVAAGDVYVSTSRGEGLPVAVLEAMACRRPAILSDIPPHREITSGTDVVPLVDPDDLAGFVRELERLAEMTPEERTRRGEQCRAIVEGRFGLRTMHESYGPVYARATAKRSGASLRVSR